MCAKQTTDNELAFPKMLSVERTDEKELVVNLWVKIGADEFVSNSIELELSGSVTFLKWA